MKGHLYANRNLPAPTKAHLKERLKRLQDLAKQSIHGKDNLHKDNVDDCKKDGVWKVQIRFGLLYLYIYMKNILVMAKVSRMTAGLKRRQTYGDGIDYWKW